MRTHFKNHNNVCACTPSAEGWTMTKEWIPVDCLKCKTNAQYLMAKQDSPKQATNGDETMKEVVNVRSQEEWDYVTKFYKLDWRGGGSWNNYFEDSAIRWNNSHGYGTVDCYKSQTYTVLTFQEWQAKYDHPVFRRALRDKVDMKLEVTPEESRLVQEICFSCGVKWGSQHKRATVKKTKELFLHLYRYSITGEYILSFSKKPVFNSIEHPLFSFKDDCFVDEIKQELSDCGKTFDEFMASKHMNDSNVEFCAAGTWVKSDAFNLVESIKSFGLQAYRIVELSACGRNINEFTNALWNKSLYCQIKNKDGWSNVFGSNDDAYNLVGAVPLNTLRLVKQSISACGKTLDEFMEACDDDCRNMECNHTRDGWIDAYLQNKLNIFKHGGELKDYRIKEPSTPPDCATLDFNQHARGKVKPPLGLKPRYISNEQRLEEIKEAFARYIKAEKDIPHNWVNEYLELSKTIQAGK